MVWHQTTRTCYMGTSDDSLNHIYRKQSLQDLQSILCNMKSLQLQWLFHYMVVTKIGSICLWHGSVKCSKLDGSKTWYCHLNGNWVQMYGYRITRCEQKQSIYKNYYKKILQQFVNRDVFIIISPLMTKGLSLPS